MLKRQGRSLGADRATVITAVLALVAFVPTLLTRPGFLAADTKAYLFIDPGGLLERASTLWDPNLALGTVTHQNIGYLFPLGPFFWLVDALPMPMWVGQRLWIGATLFAAGAGFVWLGRRLSLTGWPLLAGALVYQLSPYTVAYLGRTSVILLPWAALPWLIGLARRSLNEGGWRAPAWFALVVTVVGSTNASSLIFIGLAPILWFPFAVWVTEEAEWRAALWTMARIGLLLIPTQLWWMAGLSLQAAYGLPILELTETVETVAETSTAAEIVRHLGYWYLYGRDALEPWTEAVRFYTQNLPFILISFSVPTLAALSGFTIRWKYRAFAVALILLGLVIGVGTHPYDHPPPIPGAIKAAADFSAAGMALRNSPRAVPLLVLGSALLITAGLGALQASLGRWRGGRHWRLGPAATALVCVLALANLPSLWTGGIVQSNLEFPETLPEYWQDATNELDRPGDDTRVLEIPGMDFGTYRWGNTQDVITPGLLERPWVGRQLIPYGTPGSADLIRAFDRRMQEGWFEPESVGPVARLMGATDVLLRSDTQYERYRLPRPRALWEQITAADLIGDPVGFGPQVRNRAVAKQPMIDEIELGLDPETPEPWPVALFPIDEVRPEVRTASDIGMVIAGDGDGVVDLAAAGLLGDETFIYSATLAEEPESIADLATAGARLVLTDTNRRQAERWGTLRENAGYTEQAGEVPLVRDPSDNRLPIFPDADDSSFTTTRISGVRSIRASAYGNPVSYTPEDRPVGALDGELGTAWKVGAFDEVRGERLAVELIEPVSAKAVNVVQPLDGPNRWITEVEVRLDGRSVGRFALHEESRSPEGQDLPLPEDPFKSLEIVITDANIPRLISYSGFSPVGFAEIRIPGIVVDEIIELPSDLLEAAGPALDTSPLDVVLTRVRSNPAEPFRRDPELALARVFDLPVTRQFSISGTARLAQNAPDHVIDQWLGPRQEESGITVRTSDHLAGSAAFRGSAAFDGDVNTFWTPGFTDQRGRWIELNAEEPVSVQHLDLQIVADGRHSVPTRIEVSVDGQSQEVELPAVADGPNENHVESVAVSLARPLVGHSVRLTVLEAREVRTIDSFSSAPLVMPIGIAEVGIRGMALPPSTDSLPSECHEGLITVNGRSVPFRLSGTLEDAEAGRPLAIEVCDLSPLDLPDGEVIVRTAMGLESGINIDRLVLRSEGRGSTGENPSGNLSSGPRVEVTDHSKLGRRILVSEVDGPFWLVFGQSHSLGWEATAEGLGKLGSPMLVDGHANGWLVDVPDGVTELSITIAWTPQTRVWAGVAVSVLAVLGCIAILIFSRRHPERAFVPRSEPVLVDPSRLGGKRPSLALGTTTTVALGLAGWLLGGVAVGIAVAAASAGALAWDRGRLILSIPGALTLGPVALFVVAIQWRRAYPIGVEWPGAFDPVKWFVLTSFLLLGADVVVGWIRRRQLR